MALITVVCTGNINRSPFAAALLRARLDESYIVTSAGLTANGLIPPSSMLKAAKKAGVDLAQHRSRLLTAQDVDTSDLVLCMDRTHPIRIAAIAGLCSKVILRHRVNDSFSAVTYVLLGWVPGMLLIHLVPAACQTWIVLGGVSYTVGVVFLKLDHKVKFFHAVWHLLVIVGSGCHF